MSRDSRSRSRSPMNENDDLDDSRRRHDKRKFDRPAPTSNIGKRGSSDCGVYVSNIPYEFKWQDLKDLFRSEVGNVAYVEMFNDDNGKPRGSAIVDFDTPEMAQRAMEKMHQMDVKGRKLKVKAKDDVMNSREFLFLFNKGEDRDRGNRFGKDMDRRRGPVNNRLGNNFGDNGPPQPINYGNTYGLSIPFLESLGINGPLVNKVFVSNLEYKVTEDDLKELFKMAGKVVNSEIIRDLDNKSRGFGVVEFEHPLQAVQSISLLHNQTYYDRKIIVRLDRVAEKNKKDGKPGKLPPGLKSIGMGFGENGEPIVDLTGLPSGMCGNQSSNTNQVIPPVNNNMGMGAGFNLPAATNLNANLRNAMTASLSMMGLTGLDSLPLGGANSAAMNMGSHSQLGAGVGAGMNTSNMGSGMGGGLGAGIGSNLNSNMGSGMGANNSGLGSGIGGMPNVSNMGGGGGVGGSSSAMNQNNMSLPNTNTYGNQQPMGMGAATGPMFNNASNNYNNPSNNSDFNSNPNPNPNFRSIVQITNLPMDYTWKNLKDLCRNYGDIRFAEMKNKGVGWVRYSTEAEARRSADMLHRQRFDGRMLEASVI